jgi:hypothetical protein
MGQASAFALAFLFAFDEPQMFFWIILYLKPSPPLVLHAGFCCNHEVCNGKHNEKG